MDLITPEKIKTRNIWQKCPNCNGYGTVSFGKRTCVSCNGKGVLLLPVESSIDDDGGFENANHNR